MVDNQHRKISGYRELTDAEIDLMNSIKRLERAFNTTIDLLKKADGIDQRNVALAQTHGEDAFMRAVRAVAQPERLTDGDDNWLTRLVAERDQLAERRQKLSDWIAAQAFSQMPEIEQEDLRAQHRQMDAYLATLNRRIERTGA